MRRFARTLAVCLTCIASLAVAADVTEWISGINWAEPPLVTPGAATSPPSDAIVLFDGADLSQWEGGDKWLIQDGYAVTQETSISTKQGFGDCQLHIEFATPEEIEGSGQGRGNSGIYLMGRYELQVLDSWENETYFDGQCGAIYKQHPPLVNASRKPGEWQTYDVVFKAPRFHPDGSLLSPAAITVLHNGVLIQNHFQLLGSTSYTEPPLYKAHGEREPISLQFHGNKTKFRNIWIRDLLPPAEAQ
jgi:hypothetical protein